MLYHYFIGFFLAWLLFPFFFDVECIEEGLSLFDFFLGYYFALRDAMVRSDGLVLMLVLIFKMGHPLYSFFEDLINPARWVQITNRRLDSFNNFNYFLFDVFLLDMFSFWLSFGYFLMNFFLLFDLNRRSEIIWSFFFDLRKVNDVDYSLDMVFFLAFLPVEGML